MKWTGFVKMDDLFSAGHRCVFMLCSSRFKGIKETALHLAVRQEERSSLALVDFLCQNRSDSDESSRVISLSLREDH